MSYQHQQFDSPIGPLHLVADHEALCAVLFPQTWTRMKNRFHNLEEKKSAMLNQAKQQLADYFDGKRVSFDLPLKLNGTAFQKRVWLALATIPFGQTTTYKQLAAVLNSPKAVRAVGRTNGLNPLSIVLPCHRVIGSDGSLTGYAGGLKNKAFLLNKEQSSCSISVSV